MVLSVGAGSVRCGWELEVVVSTSEVDERAHMHAEERKQFVRKEKEIGLLDFACKLGSWWQARLHLVEAWKFGLPLGLPSWPASGLP